MAHTPAPACPPSWMEKNEDCLTQSEAFRALQHQRDEKIAKHFADNWQTSLDKSQKKNDRSPTTITQATQFLKRKSLNLHENLAKPEAHQQFQTRTEKTGFARVPALASPASQTAKTHCHIRRPSNKKKSVSKPPKRPKKQPPPL